VRAAGNAAILAIVVGAAIATVAATYSTFSATADEPLHVGAGLEWMEGRYRLAPDLRGADPRGRPSPVGVAVAVDPPLARVSVALLPYLHGLRVDERAGVRGLFDGGGGQANLTRARLGVLPFLVAVIVLTWATARLLFGPAAGLAAAAALICVPAVLGHAALATTDVAFAATFLLATWALLVWLDRPGPACSPSWARTVALGATFGLAAATKLSAVALLPCAAVVVFHRWRSAGPAKGPLGQALRRATAGVPWAHIATAGALAALVVWAAYRFSFGRPSAAAGPQLFPVLVDRCFAPGLPRRLAGWWLERSVPAPELWDGLLVVCGQNRPGQTTSYLLGRISQDGFRLYFPIALATKTPLPFLALAAIGIAWAARRPDQARWRSQAPALIALTVLALVIPLRINAGVRHVLHLYPLLAIYAGAGAVALFRAGRRRSAARALAAVLVGWLLTTPARAAPDHMAWFNVLGGRSPENVLLDSDLDWGQDLHRLEQALADWRVPELSLAYFGASELCRRPLPPGRWLRPYERTAGWVAISEMYRKGVVGFSYRDGNYCDPAQWVVAAPPDPDQYAWLDAYAPVARVGRSILVYRIPDGQASAAPGGGAGARRR
jgi:4-amino-4-deoxy-L-arabinose transferase-like glycosyltransferase